MDMLNNIHCDKSRAIRFISNVLVKKKYGMGDQ